jgi:para-nitrobenzyl esterase
MVAGRLRSAVTSASGLPFGPVIDGHVLPRPPLEAIADGSAASVPLLTGTTRDEWNLFGLMDRTVEDHETVVRRLRRVVDQPESVAAVYAQARPEATPDELFKHIMTDRMFRLPAIRMAEAQAAHQPQNTFLYLFEFASTAFDGRLGSCHALEIPFVFDNLHKRGIELMTGADPPAALAAAMHAAWIAFARTGAPGDDALPAWPSYREGRSTMYFGVPPHLEDDPDAAERSAWSGRL